MKKFLIAALLAASVAASHDAHADKTTAGLQLQVMPSGTLDIKIHGQAGGLAGNWNAGESPMETAFGIAGIVDYSVHRNVTVGLAPRVVLNEKTDPDQDASTQLDIPLRVTGLMKIGKLTPYGYLSPGYSIIFPSHWNENGPELDHPAGLILDVGAGVAYGLSKDLRIVGDIGYTAGYQGFTEKTNVVIGTVTTDVTFATSFLHIGVGVQM